MFSEEKLQQLKTVNEKLNLNIEDDLERSKNIIFVYCPPKVGGTTLVSSIRIFASYKYTVCHIHDETLILSLTNETDISVMDVIRYNRHIGKNVWVIDIYRPPIERKISVFFEYICDLHFNDTEENIARYDLSRIAVRFNNLSPHFANEDYFMNEYNLPSSLVPSVFDFHKRYMEVADDSGIRYIKLRLQDATDHWSTILSHLFQINIRVVKDNSTQTKTIGDIYQRFTQQYKIPLNYWKQMQESPDFIFYNTDIERKEYESKYATTVEYNGYTDNEYILYKAITFENCKKYIVQHNHYMDNGCMCQLCKRKRFFSRESVLKGGPCERIIHHVEVGNYNEYKQNTVVKINAKITQLQHAVLRKKKKPSMAVLGI